MRRLILRSPVFVVTLLAAACARHRAGDGALPNAATLSLVPDTLTIFHDSGGVSTEIARMVQSYRRTVRDGRPVIEQVSVLSSASHGDAVDSMWLADPSLRPLRHRRRGGPMPMALDYVGSRVSGVASVPGTVAQAVDVDLGEPVFDAASSDLIVRALPLRKGLHADLPTYAPTFAGIRRLVVQDVSEETCRTRSGEERPCWVVTTDYGDDPTTMKVARDTRALLEVDEGTMRFVR